MIKYKNKQTTIKIIVLFVVSMFLVSNILLPVSMIFKKAFYSYNKFFGLQNFCKIFDNDKFLKVLYNSITISLSVTCITLIMAFLFAYGVERTNIKGKTFYNVIAVLPLFAPTMAYGIALIYIFGNNGILSTGFFGMAQWMRLSVNIYGKIGIIIAEVIYVFPAVYLIFLASFKMIDYSFYEVADIMGLGVLKKFVTITIPNMKNSIINAFFSSFIMVFTDFGAAKIIGGNYKVLALKFYENVVGQNKIHMGAAIAVILIIPSMIYLIIYNFMNRNINNSTNINKTKKYVIKRNIVRDYIFTLYNSLISIIVICVFIVIVIASLIKNWPYDLSITFKYYNINSVGISLLDVYKNTLFIALATALIGTIMVFLAAYIVERYKEMKYVRKIIYFLSSLPLALPGMVIGLSYILFFNKRCNPMNFLYGTYSILIIANIVHFFSIPFFTISDHLKKLNGEFEDVGECMGISWYITLIKVIIPESIFPILKSFSYYFVNSMVTISAVSFLYTSNTKVAAIEIINKSDSGDITSATAITVTIVLINIIIKLIFNGIEKKLSRQNRETS